MASVPASPPLVSIPTNLPPSDAPALPADSHEPESQPNDNGKKQKKQRRKKSKQPNSSDNSYSSRSWASKEQWDFLTSKLSAYREAARNKKHNRFYEEMTDEWQCHGWKFEECGNKKPPELKLGEERQYAKELRKRAHGVSLFSLKIAGYLHAYRQLKYGSRTARSLIRAPDLVRKFSKAFPTTRAVTGANSTK